jgi:hypothetical protein
MGEERKLNKILMAKPEDGRMGSGLGLGYIWGGFNWSRIETDGRSLEHGDEP